MTRSTEKLIHAALRDGCREHCDALIDELRRLAKVEDEWAALSQDQGKLESQIDRRVAQRDALLEACRAMLTFIERHAPRGLQPEPGSPVAMARAAIKAVEGENT